MVLDRAFLARQSPKSTPSSLHKPQQVAAAPPRRAALRPSSGVDSHFLRQRGA